MYVNAKNDCSHVEDSAIFPIQDFKNLKFESSKCSSCEEITENWICLRCGEFNCGRYINEHSSLHFMNNEIHCIVISLLDFSIWCYKCQSYIENRMILNKYEKVLSDLKFGVNFNPTIENVVSKFPNWKIDEKKISDIKYHNFIELFKEKKCMFLN